MNYYVRLTVTILLTALGSPCCALPFCDDGYMISRKYSECWTQATFANRYENLYKLHEEYTAKLVEDYATHMCSVVKPHAIQCMKSEISECSNMDKILEMADESGGTCDHNKLNAFFKLHIIDHLAPVKNDSPCLSISDKSDCYNNAVKGIKTKGIPISRFHYEADKFFASIWECQVRLFKANADICQNWQLPMLLSLQSMAMPSLFGMKLTDRHVAMLELEKIPPPTRTSVISEGGSIDSRNRFFILLKVLTQKPELGDGDVLLQVNIGAGTGNDRNNVRITNITDKKKKDKQPKPTKVIKEKTKDNEDESLMIN